MSAGSARGLRVRRRPARRPRGYLMASLWLVALVAALLLLSLQLDEDPAAGRLIRAFALAPVLMVALWSARPAPTLVAAAFFGLLFLWDAVVEISARGFTETAAELATLPVILAFAGYVFAGIAASFWARQRLIGEIDDHAALLARTNDIEQVVDYLLAEAPALTAAERAIVLLRDPLSNTWEALTGAERVELRATAEWEAAPPNLAEWLTGQAEPQLLTDLDNDPRFVPGAGDAGPRARSVLAIPLTLSGAAPIGVLVLAHQMPGAFDAQDLRAAAALAEPAAQALLSAGQYAQIDQDRARRGQQIATLQRAAQELNAALEPGQIAELALRYAVEVTRAAAGLLVATPPGLPQERRVRGAAAPPERIARLAEIAAGVDGVHAVGLLDDAAGPLLAGARSRVIATIQRKSHRLGFLVIESLEPAAFDPADLQALANLTDYAAVALENARLFAEVRRERQRVQQIITTMADGLLTIDAAGRVMACNPAAEALTGWRSDETLGHPVSKVLGCAEDDTAMIDALQGIEQPGAVREGRLTAHLRSGARRIVAFSAAALPTGGAVVLVRDITAQEELKEFQGELVATFSHELRAPLSNIAMLMEILLESPESAAAIQREQLESIQAQSRRLAGFVDKILGLARLESGRWEMEPRPLPLRFLLEEALQSWSSAAPHAALRMVLPDEPLWAWADESAAQVVLNNLLDNAVKYASDGGEIVVQGAAGPAGYLTLSVTDRGTGVPPELRERIFDRFRRAAAPNSVEGHGLGLYIARRLVEAMRGKIWLEEVPEGGSRFMFTLPRLGEETPCTS